MESKVSSPQREEERRKKEKTEEEKKEENGIESFVTKNNQSYPFLSSASEHILETSDSREKVINIRGKTK